jgi:uncharacterized membrane protein
MKDIIIMAVAGILLSPTKTVYFFIVLLLFFAVPQKYGWKNAKGYLIAGGLCLASVAFLLFYNLSGLLNTADLPESVSWHGGTNYSISFVFENPWLTIWIFLNTLRVFGLWYFLGMFGQELSGLTLVLPVWYIVVFIVILAASLFHGKRDGWTPKWLHRVIFFAVCAAVGLSSMLGMFLGWTPDTHAYILGIQGRYFIPILPLAVLLFRSKFRFNRQKFAYALIGIAAIMHFLIIRYVLDFTIARF